MCRYLYHSPDTRAVVRIQTSVRPIVTPHGPSIRVQTIRTRQRCRINITSRRGRRIPVNETKPSVRIRTSTVRNRYLTYLLLRETYPRRSRDATIYAHLPEVEIIYGETIIKTFRRARRKRIILHSYISNQTITIIRTINYGPVIRPTKIARARHITNNKPRIASIRFSKKW